MQQSLILSSSFSFFISLHVRSFIHFSLHLFTLLNPAEKSITTGFRKGWNLNALFLSYSLLMRHPTDHQKATCFCFGGFLLVLFITPTDIYQRLISSVMSFLEQNARKKSVLFKTDVALSLRLIVVERDRISSGFMWHANLLSNAKNLQTLLFLVYANLVVISVFFA